MPKTVCSICGEPEFARKWCGKHWYRWRRYGDPAHKIHRASELGYKGEAAVAKMLRDRGRNVSVVRGHKPFDLLVDDHKVEVKTATPKEIGRRLQWTFSIARAGVLKEEFTDFYVLRLEKVPYSAWPIHLFYRSPLGSHHWTVSLYGLLSQHHYQEFQGFEDFANGKFGVKRAA